MVLECLSAFLWNNSKYYINPRGIDISKKCCRYADDVTALLFYNAWIKRCGIYSGNWGDMDDDQEVKAEPWRIRESISGHCSSSERMDTWFCMFLESSLPWDPQGIAVAKNINFQIVNGKSPCSKYPALLWMLSLVFTYFSSFCLFFKKKWMSYFILFNLLCILQFTNCSIYKMYKVKYKH